MDHIEMQFEYLVRKAYGCGRFGAPGANADLYRSFMSRYHRFEEAQKKGVLSDIVPKAVEFGVKLGEVQMALDSASKKVVDRLTVGDVEQTEKIEDLRMRIHSAENPSQMAPLIGELDEILLSLGLYPG